MTNSADGEWHPSEVRNIFANWAGRSEDRLKATSDAAFALYMGGHDYAIDDLCERAIARGLDPDAIGFCLQKAQERAAEYPTKIAKIAKKQQDSGQNTNGINDIKLSGNLSGKALSKPSWRDNAVTAAILRTKTFNPVKFSLPGLITEGVNLLVSRPKLGKSWMILDVCIAASGNRYTLGNIKPMQGDVLYLALEDSERRLQSRIDKLLHTFNVTWPDRLTIVTKWRRIDSGGIDDLKEWCDSVKEPVMVVIDVFTKVRPTTKNKQLYEADYEAVGALQEFATERGIAVVLVHHDRKMEADDPFDTVSGSHGLTGAADTILILKRTANGVTLHARGRDIEEAELAVQLNRDSCKWTILGSAAEVQRSDERTRIIEALKKANGPMSVKAIMAVADMPKRSNVDFLINRMAVDGQIERVGRGQYALPKNLSDLSDLSNLSDLSDLSGGSRE